MFDPLPKQSAARPGGHEGRKDNAMTIKTLEYIHRLLLDEKAKTQKTYEAARKLQYEYEESETTDKSLAKEQEAVADESLRTHMAALNALEEFESREW